VNRRSSSEVGNPFSSRCVRPGAIPFLFPDGLDAESLVRRLQAAGDRGAIVGPHGSGKSTLLVALRETLRQSGRNALLIELHDGQRGLPAEALHSAGPGDILLVDGYEQLSHWNRWRLGRACRRQNLGLLVTSHQTTGLPTLFETSVDQALACRVVAHLQAAAGQVINDVEVAQSLARHHNDLRETLFDLYDLYESRSTGPSG
jgi:energy-coupling factor transporter ATP-binding protein EcfA2